MKNITRRTLIKGTGLTLASSTILGPVSSLFAQSTSRKKRIAVVGTGHRGSGMFGQKVQQGYSDLVEFVGLCDINPGRLQFALKEIGIACSVFTDFEKMMRETKPEILIVTTVDSTHDQFIINGLELGANIITEKPMTTDEVKAANIYDAEKRTGKKVTVTFNYRYSPHRAKIWQLIRENAIGQITSVDFNWYLNTEHGPRYFRRWHGLRDKSGTLLVHKSTHHFDLLNWWLDSDPQEVFGYGSLEVFGKNGSFRSEKCRGCTHQNNCQFYWNIHDDERLFDLYARNEHYDGYLRDACVFRPEIDIYDKMSVLIKYANETQVTYSLTTYSPYEGYRIAFNGTKGRLEAWIHEKQSWPMADYDELRLTRNFGNTELMQIPHAEGGHGGGDDRLLDRLLRNPSAPDPFKQAAGVRDGSMSILIGIAARKSIDSGKPVRISDLTEFQPQAVRPV
jgi:predicted dehydrogenase